MENILIVDAHLDRCDKVINVLKEFYNVRTVSSVKTLLDNLDEYIYDICLIDIEIPDMNGDMLIKYLKEKKHGQAAYCLITSSNIDDVIYKYYTDIVDDFISKHAGPKEILRRIDIAYQKSQLINHCLYFQDIQVNPSKMEIIVNERKLECTLMEYKILINLIRLLPIEKYVNKSRFIEILWGDTKVEEKTVNTHIANLNKKMDKLGYRVKIKRLRGLYIDKINS